MKSKKILMIIMTVLLIASVLPVTALADNGSKNETVYAMLNYDGSAGKIYVVNQLTGTYTDYGSYKDIVNLSTTSTPVIDGDKITFPDRDIDGGLYYQGTTTGELPFTFGIKYYINGSEITADKLAGASGHIKIDISGQVNEKCEERVRNGYMAQVTLALNQSVAENIKAQGATTVVAGNNMNINYTILPGGNGAYSLEADVKNFKMDGITITLLKGTISGFKDTIDKTKDGLNDMENGANDMVDGTTDLKDGVKSLVDGLYSLKKGLSSIASGGDDISDGMKSFESGMKNYTDGVDSIASGSENIQSGLNSLSSNADNVADGISDLNNGLKSIASNSDLKSLAESLSSSSDPSVQSLAQGTLQTLGGVKSLSNGLDKANDGVKDFTGGVKQIASQYKTFNSGLKSISGGSQEIDDGFDGIAKGFSTYLSGIKKSSNGMSKMYSSVKGLPGNIQDLIDGQLKFKDGIVTAKKDITDQIDNFVADDSPAVSFASPDKNHPDSVQYILMTQGISVQKQSTSEQSGDKEEDFFTRFADLFNLFK